MANLPIDQSVANIATGQLGALPFESIIGGPLVAAVKAQNLAAKTSVDFINAVGFNINQTTKKKEAINVEFTYKNGTEDRKLIVPILTILPIPFIRIDDININFKASISAEAKSSAENSENLSVDTEANAKYSSAFSPVSADFKASVSAKRDSANARDSRYSVEYTMDVNVHAVQDAIPAGMDQVLGILKESITSLPVGPSGPGASIAFASDPFVITGATAAAPKTLDITVTVLDADGNPKAGAILTKANFVVTPDSGTITHTISAPATATVTTNASGEATVTISATASSGTPSKLTFETGDIDLGGGEKTNATAEVGVTP
ncbi:MAG: DUF2589 domain-containing protein [Bacteroidota bacterium]